MDDLISRQEAIDAVRSDYEGILNFTSDGHTIADSVEDIINALPSVQPEPTTEIQKILNYLDTTLHPIVSPDNWNVYSELYDMVSSLLSAQSERKKGEWIPQNHNKTNGMISTAVYYYPKCSVCGHCDNYTNFCPNCGADMRGEQDV